MISDELFQWIWSAAANQLFHGGCGLSGQEGGREASGGRQAALVPTNTACSLTFNMNFLHLSEKVDRAYLSIDP